MVPTVALSMTTVCVELVTSWQCARMPLSVWASAVPYVILMAILPGLLVWIGTYAGVRLARPHQLTLRLAWTLAFVYIAIGLVLALPMRTHAVMVAVPKPLVVPDASIWVLRLSSAALSGLLLVMPLALVVGIAMSIARGLAAICGGENRDA